MGDTGGSRRKEAKRKSDQIQKGIRRIERYNKKGIIRYPNEDDISRRKRAINNLAPRRVLYETAHGKKRRLGGADRGNTKGLRPQAKSELINTRSIIRIGKKTDRLELA